MDKIWSARRRFLSAMAIASVTAATAAAVRAATPETSPGSPAIVVDIKSEHLEGTLPNGLVVDVNVKVSAEGDDPAALSGDGRHFASTGARNYWDAVGSIDGTTVTLAGVVADSNVSFLVGSPVAVVGDVSTSDITLTFGPLAGGPFRGQTLIFAGSGRVTVTTD